ncbi:MAG: dTMP kinase [Salinivirgaceae bacterium]|jgi:dTMP kinase|nr:dTMP kinase [Salinivirgaceae bacterium]
MSFIVVEGLDGSGKSTQLKLLKKHLEQNNISYKYLHFPRVEEGIFGDLVARFLRGDLGKIDEVNPYMVGLIYAGDRNDAKNMINEWKDSDHLVIIDRYVYSNMAFQGAKIKDPSEKEKLHKWLINLEYTYYGIPKPDVSLFLDVPFSFTTHSLTNQRDGDDRDYLKGKQDIHEADLSFQESVRQEYLSLLKTDDRFKLIECFNPEMKMLSPTEIFDKILNELVTHKII